MKIRLLHLFFSLLIPFSIAANSCTTSAGAFASWAALTWTCTMVPVSGPPGCGDVINIGAGTTVQISADVDYSGCATPIDLHIYGTMNFPTNGVRFKLPAGSSVTVESGGKITKSFPGGGSSTLISIGGVNVWTAGDGTVTGPIVLPIELLSFSATAKMHSVLVEWSTASELNNDFFTVERSADGISFESIGTLDGAGNNIGVLNYSFEDVQPMEGINYYRLRQTDFNGLTNTFEVAEVDFHTEADFSFTVSPNPNRGDNIHIFLNAEEGTGFELQIFDLTGRPVYSKTIMAEKNGPNTYSLDFERSLFSPGMYMVALNSLHASHYAKMIVD